MHKMLDQRALVCKRKARVRSHNGFYFLDVAVVEILLDRGRPGDRMPVLGARTLPLPV